MSPTSLLDTPLTLIQAQQAAALDDLLRFIVVNDGCRWDAIEKKMGKVSYEGLYEVCVAETGSKASRGARVEYVQRYFRQHDFTRHATAGIPNAVFHELITTWKARATDDWAHITLLRLPAPLSRPDPSSSTSSPVLVQKVTRITASCGIKTTHSGDPMKALNIIALDLDDDLPYHAYIEAGFDAGAMIQMEKYGGWKLLLGPGTAIRKACSACWNCKALSSDSPAYTTPILLCEDAWQGDELFVASGQVEDDTWQCPRPDHNDRNMRWSNRRQPSDCLVTVNDMSVWAEEYTSRRAQDSGSSPSPHHQVTKPVSDIPVESSYQNIDVQPASHSLPSRIILKIPSHIRSIPLRTRKLDLAIHRQIIRSHILLKAQRITRTVRRKLEDAKLEIQQVNLEVEKKRVEWSLAVAREARSKKALLQAKESIKEKRKLLAELRDKDEARQVLAEEAVKKLEVAEKEIGGLRTGLKKERQKVSDLILRNNSLEAQVQIAAENIQSARESARTHAENDLRAAHEGEMDRLKQEHQRSVESIRETCRTKEKCWEGRLNHLQQERASVEGRYQHESAKQYQQAQEFISRLQQEIHMLRSQPPGQQGSNVALDQANATIADLRADLDVAWVSVREKTSEVNRLRREVGRQGPTMPPGAVAIRGQNAHSVAQGLRAVYAPMPDHTAALAGSNPMSTHQHTIYKPSPYTLPTPPRTASPANSHRSFSPGELTIGTTRMGVWFGEGLEEISE